MVSFPPPTQVPFCVNISSTCYHKKQMIQLWHCDADLGSETAVLWPPHAKSWLIGKDSDAGRDWGQEEKGTTEDEMAGWDHQLDRHEFEWTLGVGDGQGGLACCSSWGCKESDTTEWLNWTELRGSLSPSTILTPSNNWHIQTTSISMGYVHHIILLEAQVAQW